MPDAWRRMRRAEARLCDGCEVVAGVDEAGRGPLAGPVVAAAVVLDHDAGDWDGLNDSKQMSAAAREALYARVLEQARAWQEACPRRRRRPPPSTPPRQPPRRQPRAPMPP